MRFLLSVTLADGERYEFRAAKMPRHWKSWVMQQMPWDTNYVGSRFDREVIA